MTGGLCFSSFGEENVSLGVYLSLQLKKMGIKKETSKLSKLILYGLLIIPQLMCVLNEL